MIDLTTFTTYVKDRQDKFDSQCNALRIRNELTTLAALYIDVLVSNAGETGWDSNELYKELDDIFEELREAKIKFMGDEISLRRTDKDDPNVLKYLETVPRIITVKDGDGNARLDDKGKAIKREDGTKEIVKKKHLHKETMQIIKMPKTNAYGIPVFRFYGEYHRGGYYPTAETFDYYNSFSKNNALKISPASKRGLAIFAGQSERVDELFFTEIDERSNYGLATLVEINVANGSVNKPAGMIRLDFDIEDIDNETVPVIKNIAILFNSTAFVRGHVSTSSLLENTMNFITTSAEKVGIVLSPEYNRVIITDGGIENFKRITRGAEQQSRNHAHLKQDNQQRLNESLARQEELNRRAEEDAARQREAEKQRLKKEREQERIKKAAEQAEKAVEKHNKAVEKMMTTLVTSIIQSGGTPGRAVYRTMRENIENDVTTGAANLEEVELILEAIDKLIETDTNA